MNSEVAVNTNDKEQKRIAKLILENMRLKDTKLVGDAQILSSELMRIAITPQVFGTHSNVSFKRIISSINRNYGMMGWRMLPGCSKKEMFIRWYTSC